MRRPEGIPCYEDMFMMDLNVFSILGAEEGEGVR